MEIDLIFKIAAIGIIVAVLNQLLIRSGREDQAMMTTLAGCSRHCSMQFWKSRPPPMHSCSPLGQRWCCWCGQGQASGQYFPA